MWKNESINSSEWLKIQVYLALYIVVMRDGVC